MTKRWLLLSLVPIVLASTPPAAADSGRDSGKVERFATLPRNGPGFPEGIAADRRGNLYVSTFDFTQPNVIYKFDRRGELDATISVAGTLPLGLEFDARGRLYATDFGAGNVLRFDPPFNSGSLPARTYPICGGQAAGCALNAMTFDRAGFLYVSDSFGGRVFRLDVASGAFTPFVEHELLRPGSHGFPPFGANGLAFDKGEANLYIANTADDRILRYNVAAATLTTFAESVNGADGIAFDRKGRLWVAANQADELVALNSNGRPVERRGSFEGIGRDGAPKGLLFPASIVIVDGELFVTNLALALTPAVGDEPEEDVTTFTVSRVPLED